MPRTARVVIPGHPHHVTQRGNNRSDVFFVDDDRRVYLELLKERSAQFGLEVAGYCLMTNHVHLVVIPKREDSLSKAVGRTNLKYTQYINRLHGRSGHLWQDRFFSIALDEQYFWAALAYVERNPVRAKMVHQAWDWPWSSASAHVLHKDLAGLLDLGKWRDMLDGRNWQETLASPLDELMIARLRRWSNRGCPLGSDSFISKMERLVGRRLRPLPVGRPKKPKNRKRKGKKNEK